MYITAIYASGATFKVSGDRRGNYPPLLAVLLYQSQGDPLQTTVQSTDYMPSSDFTLVTVSPAICVPTLYRVELGPTFGDPVNQKGNVGEHRHSGHGDGGYTPFSRLNDDQIDSIVTVPMVAEFEDNGIMGVNDDHSAFEPKSFVGTNKRVTVTHETGRVVLSGPQDLDSTDSPTFVGLTLTGLVGLLNSTESGVTAISGLEGEIPVHDGTIYTPLIS